MEEVCAGTVTDTSLLPDARDGRDGVVDRGDDRSNQDTIDRGGTREVGEGDECTGNRRRRRAIARGRRLTGCESRRD